MRRNRRSMVRHVHAQLPVSDLDRAMAFHRRLGLDVEAYEGGGHAFVSERGDEVWHLREVADLADGASDAAVYVHVHDPDEVRDRFVEAGLAPTAVASEPWGMREFSVVDPDGNLLRFGTNV